MNIYEKMLQIMKEVDYIQKDKKNTFHKYNYASEYAIKKAIHEALVKNKVLFNVSVIDQTIKDTTTAKGEPTLNTSILMNYKFINVEEPKEIIEGQFIGQGDDKLGKGAYKAITGAIKYCLTSNFLIPTGDDPEVPNNGYEKSDTYTKCVQIIKDHGLKTKEEKNNWYKEFRPEWLNKKLTKQQIVNAIEEGSK